ncbi:Poly(3-hydroxybutyrate) depolymerase [Cupriavidus taiwanensis]|uniref:extracellular catalytic domain type 1 short-chain-length polyhydroxyalkanoate depolymerase n=1 Tax=Cupriavidus taiwanensis TaxID=164546 RepID=UPI000E160568|nr:PHB depolymerase family esterase [Cupriavidus taiwanensis]SPA18699.1 Poly(3-hydroxybutyrate) depolymerase [Cupriavidus taiwanensis]
MPRSPGAKLWSTLNKTASRHARQMQRAVNKNLTKPMTEAIVRNAVKQSAAVTAATQRALSGVVSPVAAPQSRGSGRWEEGTWGAPLAPRRYRIFVPAGATASRRAPMLVLLHGCGQDAASFAAVTRAAAVARESGWVVLLPEQSSQANAQRCWNWFRPAAQGAVEAGLLMALIDQACRRHPVAADRISVLGLSAGGAMALTLGLRYPSRFAAVGSHSGAVPWSASNAAQATRAMRGQRGPDAKTMQALRFGLAGRRPPPLLLLHGDTDHVVDFSNATAAAGMWMHLQPEGTPPLAGVPARRIQRGMRHAIDVFDWYEGRSPYLRLVRVEGLGHAWSGGAGGHAFSDPAGPDGLKLALRFFLAVQV